MEFFEKIMNAIKAVNLNRNVTLPGAGDAKGPQGFIQLDANGNETLLYNADYERVVSYTAARIQDIVDLPEVSPSVMELRLPKNIERSRYSLTARTFRSGSCWPVGTTTFQPARLNTC